MTGWVKRHKILTGLIAGVTVIWFFSAVGQPTTPPQRHGHRTVPPTMTSSSSPNDEADKEPTPKSSPTPKPKPKKRTYRVVHVVDGDTIDLGNGETVRLAGIDAPEVGECGYKRARNKLVATRARQTRHPGRIR